MPSEAAHVACAAGARGAPGRGPRRVRVGSGSAGGRRGLAGVGRAGAVSGEGVTQQTAHGTQHCDRDLDDVAEEAAERALRTGGRGGRGSVLGVGVRPGGWGGRRLRGRSR